MNKMKKFASIATAVLMTACMAAPMTMSLTASAVDIVVTADPTDTGTHSYEAYQIFKGTLANEVLSNIEWGTGVDSAKYDSIYTELAKISVDDSGTTVYPFKTASGSALTSASDVATALGNYTNYDNDVAKKFASIIGANLSDTKSGTSASNGVNSITEAGYYLVQDSSNSPNSNVGDNNSGAKTRYILKIVDTSESTITVTEKAVAPTVDKQVWDETTDAEAGATNGWGETADHAINESFNFKLIANLPADTEYESYEKYKVVFNDKMSTGVTFEGIDSVKVDGVDVSDYTLSDNVWDSANRQYIALAGNGTEEWTLTIADIKSIAGVDLSDGATIEVIYSAHLNESAAVTKSGANETLTDKNRNDVYLQYSNNPNATGTGAGEDLGKTPDDSVWVFTYEVDNTKYKNAIEEANKLGNAGFTLYSGGTAVELFYDDTLGAYRKPKTGETSITEMMSSDADTNKGQFNIVGLDAGTYILKETTTPAGYNTCADIEIVIEANHSEEAANTSAKVEFTSNTKGMNNDIINKAGSSLPSTGGIGTTLFYVGGGAMVAVAGVFLITKKRMGKKED